MRIIIDLLNLDYIKNEIFSFFSWVWHVNGIFFKLQKHLEFIWFWLNGDQLRVEWVKWARPKSFHNNFILDITKKKKNIVEERKWMTRVICGQFSAFDCLNGERMSNCNSSKIENNHFVKIILKHTDVW